ncbi:MAG: isochorismatase family protein [Pirellulales bacterium]|nr:isochorismatase family protein [Pirellulales bacterium]
MNATNRNPRNEPNHDQPLLRSTELMRAGQTGLLVVDIQEKLIPHILDHARIVWNARRLIDGALTLGVAIAATEQYPRGLGKTVEPLASKLPGVLPDKVAFSCGACGGIFTDWKKAGIHYVLVCGIETHVCVQQTALDLLAAGFRVYLAVDAIGARGWVDHEIALRRMESAGATLTTTEAALFEWCEKAGTAEFQTISQLVKERGLDE